MWLFLNILYSVTVYSLKKFYVIILFRRECFNTDNASLITALNAIMREIFLINK